MPNQRKAGKKQIAIWLTEKERNALKRIASGRGIDVTELVRLIALGKERGERYAENSNSNKPDR